MVLKLILQMPGDRLFDLLFGHASATVHHQRDIGERGDSFSRARSVWVQLCRGHERWQSG